jgi:hypothetical protein
MFVSYFFQHVKLSIFSYILNLIYNLKLNFVRNIPDLQIAGAEEY